MLDKLTVDDFTPLAGQEFMLPDGLGALTLVSATPSKQPAPQSARAGFSLLFRGSAAKPLGQGVVPLSHPSFNTLELFIVPVGTSDSAREYEAVFN